MNSLSDMISYNPLYEISSAVKINTAHPNKNKQSLYSELPIARVSHHPWAQQRLSRQAEEPESLQLKAMEGVRFALLEAVAMWKLQFGKPEVGHYILKDWFEEHIWFLFGWP